MARFDNSVSEAHRLFDVLVGVYLMVAHSDGQFSKSEEVGLRVGLLRERRPAGLTDSEFDALYARRETDFRTSPGKASDRVIAEVEALRGNGVARRAMIEVARKALTVDGAAKPQEEHALGRVAAALGLRENEV